MRVARRNRLRAYARAVRAWPVWELPRWLVAFIGAVSLLYVASVAIALARASPSWRDLALCAALLTCSAATVEVTRRIGEGSGMSKDVYGVWDLPLAILLPPVYVLVAPAFRCALVHWRVRRLQPHRRVFSAAVVCLSYGSASIVFHLVMRQPYGIISHPFAHPAAWVLAVAAAGAIRWTVNNALMLPAIKGSDPLAPKIRKLFFEGEHLYNDIAEFCVGVLVTLGIAITPVTIVFAFPFVTLLQRSFRHAQLVNASRIDSKTGLLNAGTWEREAASEVARAVRTRSPLSVALMDIDHFKGVNDAHGHLVGDAALKAISDTLVAFLRDYDLVGRFGGEEFAFLLPQTSPVDAYRIAERIRAYIAAMPIDTGDALGSGPVNVTVSIGVASLGALWDTGGASHLTDLLAAADAALYRAKRDGRDRVCVITEKATFSGSPQTPAGSLPEALVPGKPGVTARRPAGSHS